jgi:hypothetical protein
MDIYSPTWQVAVESAGIWPSVVVLGPNQNLYLFSYHSSDGEERILTCQGTTALFHDADSLNAFILGPHTGVPGDVHLALEVLSSLSPEGLEPEHFPRHLVEQAMFWISGGRMLVSEGQVQRLLDTLAFLNDWHESLQQAGMPGDWPEGLDEVAELLTDVVVTHQITTLEVAERLELKDMKPVLTQEVARLLSWRAEKG